MTDIFWKEFAQNYWEKKVLCVRNSDSALSKITEADIFKMLVQFANRCRKKKDVTGFKFFIHGFRASDYDVLQILPVSRDKSLQGYHQRMSLLFKDYCLVCDDLLHVSQKHQSELLAFSKQLYKFVGFPNRFTEIGLYLGNYKKTPFGVHVDACGVFSFPVVGQKSFRIWSPEYVRKNPKLVRAQRYAQFKKGSSLIKLQAGDMSYWPSSAWHIAESDGSFSATWSLGVWVDKEQKQVVSEVFQKLVSEQLDSVDSKPTTSYCNLYLPDGQVAEMPEAYRQASKKIRQISEEQIQKSLLISWMGHISAGGFKSLPKEGLDWNMKAGLRLANLELPVLWIKESKSKKIFVGFAGQVSELPMDRDLLFFLKKINSGNSVDSKLIKELSLTKDSKALLKNLAAGGAFFLS